MNNEYKLMEEENLDNTNKSDMIKIGVPIVGGIIGAVIAGPILGPVMASGVIVTKLGLGTIIASASTIGIVLGDLSRRVTEKVIDIKFKIFDGKSTNLWRKYYIDFIKSDNCQILIMPICLKKDVSGYIEQILNSGSDNSLGYLNMRLMSFYKERRLLDNCNCNSNNFMIIKDAHNYLKYLCKTFNHVFQHMDNEDIKVCNNTITNHVFSNVYNNVIYAYYNKFSIQDENFYKKCIKMRNHLPKDIKSIHKKINIRTYKRFLNNFEKSHTPIMKLDSIKIMLKEIQKEGYNFTADDLITALIYLLVRYSPTRIYSHLGFIDDFRDNDSGGIYEYIYITLFSAVKAVNDLQR